MIPNGLSHLHNQKLTQNKNIAHFRSPNRTSSVILLTWLPFPSLSLKQTPFFLSLNTCFSGEKSYLHGEGKRRECLEWGTWSFAGRDRVPADRNLTALSIWVIKPAPQDSSEQRTGYYVGQRETIREGHVTKTAPTYDDTGTNRVLHIKLEKATSVWWTLTTDRRFTVHQSKVAQWQLNK